MLKSSAEPVALDQRGSQRANHANVRFHLSTKMKPDAFLRLSIVWNGVKLQRGRRQHSAVIGVGMTFKFHIYPVRFG